MTALGDFIIELCDEMEELNPDWEDCQVCGPVIPWLRKNLDTNATTPTKLRVRSLMRKLRDISPDRYKIYNDRLRSMPI